MANTVTSPPSKLNNNTYRTTVTVDDDGSLRATTFRFSADGSSSTAIFARTTDKDGKITQEGAIGTGASAAERTAFGKSDSPERKMFGDQVRAAKPYGPNPSAAQQKALNGISGKPNQASPNGAGDNPDQTGSDNQQGQPPTPDQSKALNDENKSYRQGTREEYDKDLKYPINLKAESQDIIKFTVLKYSPSLAKENQTQGGGQFGSTKQRVVTLEDKTPIVKGSNSIGSITLPIPAGISDGNTVGWQNDDLTVLQQELSSIAQGFFNGGVEGATAAVDGTAKKGEAAINSDAATAVKSFFMSAGINQSAAKRSYGAVFNNNTELLFSTPGLRSFGFTFMFFPREEAEAVMVKKIIRTFKQAMSVKRSATSLLLNAPNTFAISYLTSQNGKLIQHPYLNRFKECALTSCTVDYTPDGTYMTYGGKERSMTAYRLSLQFQELEPLFDDEYGKDYDNIGF